MYKVYLSDSLGGTSGRGDDVHANGTTSTLCIVCIGGRVSVVCIEGYGR